MRNFQLALVFCGLISVVGCSGDEEGLTSEESSQLQSINSTQSNLFEAFRVSSTGATASKAEVEELSQEIQAGDCPSSRSTAAETYDKSWVVSLKIPSQPSANCAFYYESESRYTHTSRTWSTSENFSVQDSQIGKAFAKKSHVEGRQFDGAMTVTEKLGETTIQGEFNLANTIISGQPAVSAHITTTQSYTGPERENGGGEVNLVLNVGADTYSGSLVWDLRKGSPIYRVSGAEVTRTEFQSLFSSYRLIEIMERSLLMRKGQ